MYKSLILSDLISLKQTLLLDREREREKEGGY